MNKSKSKARLPLQEGDNDPYNHPILEQQMIIRFPPDIAARITASMEDENFEDFNIKFTDAHHATVKVFGEVLHAVLVNLPTTVETHRTVDGSHLFKSADIGEILIAHRPNAPPVGVSPEFMFEHGLTPPTTDIVGKRQARQEAAKSQGGPSGQLEGIEYWEMVEIQLAALLSKDKTAKPWRRQEFLQEPEVDPVVLEKVLRRNGYSEFKGYSGQEIDESEIDNVNPENEPIVRIPREVLDELEPLEEREESEEGVMTFDIAGQSGEEEAPPPPPPPPPVVEEPKREEEEDESEDEDEASRELSLLKQQMEVLRATLSHHQRSQETTNSYMKEKRQAQEAELLAKIEAHQQKIAGLEASRAATEPN
jgi:transcription initiation factor TFIID subunit 7